ncbi:hypothetical protein [Ferrovibrio sp.]|uniref:hypothetical protein n=1 Tax=Ferrovibrio sp. TaxID=1917215 RepID=UPI0035137911
MKSIILSLLSIVALPVYFMLSIGIVALAGWAGGTTGALLAIPALIFGPVLLLFRWAEARDRRLFKRLNFEASRRGLGIDFSTVNSRDTCAVSIDATSYQMLLLQKQHIEIIPLKNIRNLNFRHSDKKLELLLRQVERPRVLIECLDNESGEELEARLRAVCEAYWNTHQAGSAAVADA